jgi:large subunit ribosomal protein L29
MPRRIEKLREAGNTELEAQQRDLTEQIFRLKFQLSTGQAEALKRLRDSKKDLARVKTLIRANQLNIGTVPTQKTAQKTAPVATGKPARKTTLKKAGKAQ